MSIISWDEKENLSRSFLKRQENVGTLGLDCLCCQNTFPYEIGLRQPSKILLPFAQQNLEEASTLWLNLAGQTLSFGNKSPYSAIHLREYYHKKSILAPLTIHLKPRQLQTPCHCSYSIYTPGEAASVFFLCCYKGLESKQLAQTMGKNIIQIKRYIFDLQKFDSHNPTSLVAIISRVTS